MTCLKIAIAAILFIAVIGVCRVWFTSQTVSTLESSETLDTQIEQARSLGDDLEVQQTVLSNPTRIQAYAADTLGMVHTGQAAEYIDMSDGALAVDSNGDLSLAGSLSTIENGTSAQTAGV